MTRPEMRTSERTDLLERLVRWGTVRVYLRDILTIWSRSAPRLGGTSAQTATLRAALDELAADGHIELPATSWDNSTTPALPRYVTIPAARRTRRPKAWLSHPWCRELGWVASLPTLNDTQFTRLAAINSWLATGDRSTVVPSRFRSAELFGNEKTLDSLMRSTLFGPERITLELLACVRYPPPLAATIVGDGPDVLVVENSDPYWATAEALRSTPGTSIGAVIWGAGASFTAAVETLGVDIAGRGPVTGTVWYWGDLDPDGVRIPATAAQVATALGIAPIRPAEGLWEAFADCTPSSGDTITWTESGRGWLGEELWHQIERVRHSGARVAQEAVPIHSIEQWARNTSTPT